MRTYAFDAPYTFIYGTGCHEEFDAMFIMWLPLDI